MKVDTIQTSFSGGEFGPSLKGRTDIAQYANACEIVQNMLPRPYGPLISAPGSRYVATVSDSTLRTRLIPFVFNKTDAYIIETGDLYMRFYTNRGQIVSQTATEDLSSFGANLIAQWKCNDNTNSTTVIDSAGSYSGTLSTLTSSVSTTGIVNQAFNLAGNHYFSVSDNDVFTRTASSQPMTIIAWVYYSNNGSAQTIFSKYDSATDAKEYILYVDTSDKLRFAVLDSANGGAGANWACSDSLADGWNYVAVVFSGDGNSAGDVDIYVDAEVQSTTYVKNPSFVSIKNTATNVAVGASQAGGAKWADKIDNVAFLDIALTSTQILSLYSDSTYQISTVFRDNEVFDIHYAQINDVVWLAHKNHPPQKLIRTSANEWTIADFQYLSGPFLDENTNTAITITASATTGTVNLTVSPTTSNLFTRSGSTLGHHNSYWMIGGLAQTNATTGLQEMGYVKITNVVNSYTATATVIKNLKTSSATSAWAEGAWSAVRGYPSRVTFHERRLFFARTDYEPQKVWGSKTFEFDNYALDTQAEDDGLNLALASNESNEIQWLASRKSLIPGTYGGAFIVNSGSTEPITPDNANASEEVGFGSEPIMPAKIGNFLYYVQRFGKKLRELFYFWDQDSYKAVDRTILSPHILRDGVVDMGYQQNPDTVLYCVLTDGTMASLTREVDQEVAAWARHTTTGTYTSIAVIPSQVSDYDEAWTIVERWVNGQQKKYVEYFEDIAVPDRQDLCFYLHSGLTYNAYESTSSSATTISLSASSGSVTATVSSTYFTGAMIGKRIRAIDADGVTLGQGQITATGSTTSITLSITTTFNSLTYAAGYWGVSVSTISGLDHLESETIGILADGVKESLTRTVGSGAVTLGSDYWVVSAGLSYDQVVYTLPKEAGTQRGTAQGKKQRISSLAFKLNRSYFGFQYGSDASNLDTLTAVDSSLTQSLTTGVIGNLPFRGGYPYGAQIYIKNSDPLPIELLSIVSALDTQEN